MKENLEMNRKQELQAQLKTISEELRELRNKEASEKYAELVGKRYKYPNCYSLPQSPKDYWWLYIRVMSVDAYYAEVLKFQCDKNGQIVIEESVVCCDLILSGGYVEISEAELIAAWETIQEKCAEFAQRLRQA